MTSALTGFRAYEDETRSRLTVVRGELERLNVLARELPELERRVANMRVDGGAAPYRDENARELEDQLRAARAGRSERRNLRLEEERLMRAIEAERRDLESRGVRRITLPVLENVEIASQCDASWADMQGDADVRFCTGCKKDVYNLSMMPKDEAEAVFGASHGKSICVRLFRRDDGTVLTQDCPVGARKQRFWRRARGIASAGMIAAGIGIVAMHYLASRCVVQQAGQGLGGASLSPG